VAHSPPQFILDMSFSEDTVIFNIGWFKGGAIESSIDDGYPSTCISATCWKRLIASKSDFSLDSDIEEYKDALSEIALVALKQKLGKTS
jgi:hypothetical protein